MRDNLNTALDNVEMTYSQLSQIANDIVSQYTGDVNSIIEAAKTTVNDYSNDYIRELMLNLALHSFTFSEIKEKSLLMAQCAEILRNEAYAKEFNNATGAVAAKETIATLNTSDEILAKAVYNLCAQLLKSKADEIHRVVDVLKTILMSRLSEAKLNAVPDAQ